MPRKCVICHHECVAQINKAIAAGGSYRDIAGHFEGLSKSAVGRHSQDCLRPNLQIVAREKLVKQAIDVHGEFREQLEIAKSLRDTAHAYLSNPDDPLQLFLGPQAHEIDITYYDYNDLMEVGFGENVTFKPKKKKAKLNDILAEMAGKGLESSRVEIKTLDIRKYALDAILTTDVCIDKFARISGAYQNDKSIEQDTAGMIEALTDRLIARGWERAAARNFAQEKYGAGAPIRMID